MRMRRTTIAALALAALGAMDAAAFAQDQAVVARHGRPRIEVTPGYPVYRACVDGYRLVPRPAWGETVIMPVLHCRWVRG
jgi:ABC-type sugar transport system substrate-binding protein